MFINKTKSFIIVILAACLVYVLYHGEFLAWINTTFLKNIYSLVFLGLWFVSLGLLLGGITAFFTGKFPKINILKERAERERLKKVEEMEQILSGVAAVEKIQSSITEYATVENPNNTTTQKAEESKQEVRNGFIVKYRIKTIGTDQSEIVQAGTESEARKIIKAKYSSMDVHIISVMYNYE